MSIEIEQFIEAAVAHREAELRAAKELAEREPMDEREPEFYESGLKCSWVGIPVTAMSREELVTFIGQLDHLVTWMRKELGGVN